MARINDATTKLTTPKKDMEILLQDQDDTFDKAIEYQNLMKPLSGAGAPVSTPEFINQEYIDTSNNRRYWAKGITSSADWVFNKPISGSGAPSSTPVFVGQIYIDTTANRAYFAVATSTSADWRKIGLNRYGTVTVVAGSGDLTVNLDFDWSGGLLIVMRSVVAASYFNDGTTTVLIEVTYDALTNASYTDKHEMAHSEPTGHLSAPKTTALIGLPNAATVNSFTLDDQGGTDCYVKWFIIA